MAGSIQEERALAPPQRAASLATQTWTDWLGAVLHSLLAWWWEEPAEPPPPERDPRRLSAAQQGPPPPRGSHGSIVMTANVCVSPRPHESLSKRSSSAADSGATPSAYWPRRAASATTPARRVPTPELES